MSLVDSTPARCYSQHDEGVNAVSHKGPSKELGMARHFSCLLPRENVLLGCYSAYTVNSNMCITKSVLGIAKGTITSGLHDRDRYVQWAIC